MFRPEGMLAWMREQGCWKRTSEAPNHSTTSRQIQNRHWQRVTHKQIKIESWQRIEKRRRQRAGRRNSSKLFILMWCDTDLLIEFEPGAVAFTVHILEAEEPDLPQTHCLHHLRSKQKEMHCYSLLKDHFKLNCSQCRQTGNGWIERWWHATEVGFFQ